MNFLNTMTQEYPRHHGDLELLGWSVGEPLPQDWVEVLPSGMPMIESNQEAIELAPELVSGVWTQRWSVVDLSEEEVARRKEFLEEMRRP
jgi:hypothetical protein